MNPRVKFRWLLCAVVVWGTWESAAHAQFGGGSNGFYLFNLPSNMYGMDSVPYYSLHPPVYYSLPVARTYGYSPFAYPPGFMTPEIMPPEPRLMVNPHAPRRSSPKRAAERVTMAPRVIENPYASSRRRSSPQVAILEGPRAAEPVVGGNFETHAGP
ncbi:MAG TPA: hypothetical protein VMV69_27725 [Pirellulales bacterium]|nr:hypothetical protein [Pirellulales bacterium]